MATTNRYSKYKYKKMDRLNSIKISDVPESLIKIKISMLI